MYEWILLLALTTSALSLTAAFLVCRICRRMRREKERSIAQALLEQERLLGELAQTRGERQRLKRVLTARLPLRERGATERPAAQRFDTPYNN